MTFFHFCNCFCLSFVPYIIVYKYGGLSEYSSVWKCCQAGSVYLVAQLIKMLFLATFFPVYEPTEGGGFNVLLEFFKSSIDILDLFAINFVLNRLVTKGQLKFLVAGMGWATAELLVTCVFPLWVGARAVEFSWTYVQMGFESNLRLIQYVILTMLVWLFSRGELRSVGNQRNMLLTLMGAFIYESLLLQLLVSATGIGGWMRLFIKVVFVLLHSLLSLQCYFFCTAAKTGPQNGSLLS